MNTVKWLLLWKVIVIHEDNWKASIHIDPQDMQNNTKRPFEKRGSAENFFYSLGRY